MENLETLYTGAQCGDVVQCYISPVDYFDGVVMGRIGPARYSVLTKEGDKRKVCAHEIVNNITQQVRAS